MKIQFAIFAGMAAIVDQIAASPFSVHRQSLPAACTKSYGDSAGKVLSLRGGDLPSGKDMAKLYATIYAAHGSFIQYRPQVMAKFYGSPQESGSLADTMYSSAGSSQLGAAVLIFLSTLTSASTQQAVAWSFLPYLADVIPLVAYSAKSANSYDVGTMTMAALLYGISSLSILTGDLDATTATTIAKVPAIFSLIYGVFGTLAPVHSAAFVGPKISASTIESALWRGREIILALHGLLATLLLFEVDALTSVGILTAVFVPTATIVGFLTKERELMKVSNVVAWNGWILLSAAVALRTLL